MNVMILDVLGMFYANLSNIQTFAFDSLRRWLSTPDEPLSP